MFKCPFTLASLYVPNEKPVSFLDKCLNLIQGFACGPLIIGGDVNCLMDPKINYSGPQLVRDTVWHREGLNLDPNQLLEKYCLHGVWCSHHLKERNFTYFLSHHESHSRLDYLLTSTMLIQHFVDSSIELRLWSDHAWTEGGLFKELHGTQTTVPT